jgi:uncharacterized protein
MKPSRYNFFFQVDDEAILGYNSLTTALAKLSAQEFAALQDVCDEPRDDLLDACGPGFHDDLVKDGFLVPDGCEELEQIETLHNALKMQRQHSIGLTIVPTLDCNFRCTYCFSYARPERMSAQVQEALLRFVEARLPDAGSLSVAWYGGEPTLCLDTIEALSTQLRDACERHGARYLPASIVTNGYLLTEKVAQRLKAAGITQAQVTLDGDRDTHNGRRPLQGGVGTFDRILDNVAAARDILAITIRINVDRSNAGTAVAALDALVEHGLQGMPAYFGHVKPYTEACAGMASDCFSDDEFGELNLTLTRQAIARGFASLHRPELQLGGVCGAESESSYLIAPDGLLFRCWAQASLGAEHAIGNIFDDRITLRQEENLRRFVDWNPLADERCRECRVLPICMGGCPYQRLNGSTGANCTPWRHFLLDTLALRYKTGRLMKEQTGPFRDGGGKQE